MLAQEKVLAYAQQNQVKHSTAPKTVMATNMSVLVNEAALLGLRGTVSEWFYRDLHRVFFQKGMLFGSVGITPTQGAPFEIEDLPNDDAREVAQVAMQAIRDTQMGMGEAVGVQLTQKYQGNYGPMPVPTASAPAAPNPLEKLKLRLANGEITVEQFKELSELMK